MLRRCNLLRNSARGDTVHDQTKALCESTNHGLGRATEKSDGEIVVNPPAEAAMPAVGGATSAEVHNPTPPQVQPCEDADDETRDDHPGRSTMRDESLAVTLGPS